MEKRKMVPVPSKSIMSETDVKNTPILYAEQLGIDFGGLAAVRDFDVSIGRTEICGLIGPNGAGKTTVFNLLTNVYKPTYGAIVLNGKNTLGMRPDEVSRLGIARTFQNIRLFSDMSVLDNVKVGLHGSSKESLLSAMTHMFGFQKNEKEATDRAMELLHFFNMEIMADWKAGSLPYGDQRKLEIVRALATNPGILLLDEPAAGMNPSETAELMEQIREIRDTFHIAIMLIEHDMNLVMGICEGIAVLNHGRIIAKGTPDEIQNNQEVIEAYLGKRAKKVC